MESLIILLIFLMLGLAFAIGANDETMSTLVGARAIKFKWALVLAGVLSFIGVMLLARGVGKNIGSNLFNSESGVTYDQNMMLAVIISTTIWLIIASKTAAPISTTHSVVGAVIGIIIVVSIKTGIAFGSVINGSKIGQVALGWIISPLFGFVGAYIVQYAIQNFIKKQAVGLEKLEKIEKSFIIFLIFAVGWTQISRGGNDAANAMGILIGLLENGDVDKSFEWWGITLVAIMLSLGILIIGKNVIKNVGNNLIEMRPSDAFAIQMSTSIIIFIATVLALPVSGSHILIFAVLGAGRVKGEEPDKKSFNKMLRSWIITFPAAATLASIIYLIIA